MGKELELYKAFIDGLVEQKDSVTAKWVLEGSLPYTEDNQAKNEFLSSLTLEQKSVLAEMLQDEHIAGIHDTLAYINEMMDLDDWNFIRMENLIPMMLLKVCIMILSADARETDGQNKFYDLNEACDSGIGGAAYVY